MIVRNFQMCLIIWHWQISAKQEFDEASNRRNENLTNQEQSETLCIQCNLDIIEEGRGV